MKSKFLTPAGCICLEDERIAENVKTIHSETYGEKELNERNLMDKRAKHMYKVVTPFGVAFLETYNFVCSEERIIKKIFSSHSKAINFLSAK